jgi:hypothetical protein
MPAIVSTSMQGVGVRASTRTTLTSSGNTFTYVPGSFLVLHNPTGGAISPVIDGDGGTTVDVQGLGTISVASGYAVGSIAAGAQVLIPLDSIALYLKGTVSVTTATDLVASILTP